MLKLSVKVKPSHYLYLNLIKKNVVFPDFKSINNKLNLDKFATITNRKLRYLHYGPCLKNQGPINLYSFNVVGAAPTPGCLFHTCSSVCPFRFHLVSPCKRSFYLLPLDILDDLLQYLDEKKAIAVFFFPALFLSPKSGSVHSMAITCKGSFIVFQLIFVLFRAISMLPIKRCN